MTVPDNTQSAPGQLRINTNDTSVPSGTYSGVDIKLIAHLPAAETQEICNQLLQARTFNEEAQTFLSSLQTRNGYDVQQGATWSGFSRPELERQILLNTDLIRELTGSLASAQGVVKELAEVQTLSISIHREKFPVRTLGSVYPKSVTRGCRTISGSMVWTVFHEHIFTELLEKTHSRSTGSDWDQFIGSTTAITDQIPPFDITIRFSNEYGNNSLMALMGVEFVNEGMVMSVEDMFVEGTAQWIARDIDLIRNITPRPLIQTMEVGTSPTGSRLLMADLARRSALRRNPFL